MMEDQYSRTRLLLGEEGLARLRNARVAVFGLGGVGGYVTEALARSGVGTLDLIDRDIFTPSNLNRQLFAVRGTLGRRKTDAAAARVASIDSGIRVFTHPVFYGPETAAEFDFSVYDYVADCIDTVTGKLSLIEQARAAGTPVISCMGAGNKLDPSALRVGDIQETSVCPLARVMRKELKKRGITGVKVVWSTEDPAAPEGGTPFSESGKPVPGSMVFVPAAAGLLMAAEIVRDLLKGERA